MNYGRIIPMLEDQLRFVNAQNAELLERNAQLLAQNTKQSEQLCAQSEQISRMGIRIEELSQSVRSLEQALLSGKASLEDALSAKRAMGRLAGSKSEKILPPSHEPCGPAKKGNRKTPAARERGNNHARRKEHFDMEVQEHDIYPSLPGFLPEHGKFLKTVDSIRYEFIPPRFIKHVHHQHHYLYRGNIIYGKSPAAPLLNSNYDASLIAGILQLRYIYSMPVERIVKYFAENGFEMNKPTAHGLIKKTARLFDGLEKALREAIQEDDYLHMDESYYTVLEKSPKSTTGKKSSKVYIWAALAGHLKLVHFFYENGSRAQKVLTGYIKPDYRGAIQTDGLGDYKILETGQYPNAIRLACFQHCKRKFLDIPGNRDAGKIIDIINRLYRLEHKMPPGYPPQRILEYRNKHALPILRELEKELLAIKAKKSTLPKSSLAKAVNYTLKEYPALCNYIRKPEYELDNNAIERINRYISLSRKNSLFCGSHQGAKRAALIYSLACSCRLNNINTFECFKDMLERFVMIKPNTEYEELRKLLPDKWKEKR